MPLSDYEKFQQAMFDELEELENADVQRKLLDVVRMGNRCGIDVVAEIVDNKREPAEVIKEVREKLKSMAATAERDCAFCQGKRIRANLEVCEYCNGTGTKPVHEENS